MCVAALIETDEGPTSEELRLMHDDNPHGAGVAFAEGDRIRYHKSVSWDWIARNQKKFPRPYLLHFRWATHGGRARHLAHPFPLSVGALLSRRLSGTAEAVLIHNGVWYKYLDFLPRWAENIKDRLSDTAVAAYAAKVYGEEILDDVDWATAVGKAARRGRMDVTLRGRWMEHRGNLYSNLSWQVTNYPRGRWNEGPYGWDDDGRLIRTATTAYLGERYREPTIGEVLAHISEEPTPLNPDEPLWLREQVEELTTGNANEFLNDFAAHVVPKSGEK